MKKRRRKDGSFPENTRQQAVRIARTGHFPPLFGNQLRRGFCVHMNDDYFSVFLIFKYIKSITPCTIIKKTDIL